MDWKQILLLAVVIVLLLLARQLGKRRGEDGRAARMMKKYAVMTREKLEAIPDDELPDAVVCRVLAKAEQQHRPDPVKVLADLPHGSTVVYSVWAVCREMAADDYAALRHSATENVADLAAESFSVIGAADCAAAWQTLREANGDTGEAEQAFRSAVQRECPLARCAEYIRDHADDFLDDETE